MKKGELRPASPVWGRDAVYSLRMDGILLGPPDDRESRDALVGRGELGKLEDAVGRAPPRGSFPDSTCGLADPEAIDLRVGSLVIGFWFNSGRGWGPSAR